MKKVLQILTAFCLNVILVYSASAQTETKSFTIGGKYDTQILALQVLTNGNILAGGKHGTWALLGEYSTSTGKSLWELDIESESEAVCKDVTLDENGAIYVLLDFVKTIKFAEIEINRDDWNHHSVIAKVSAQGKVGSADYLLLENVRAEKLTYNKNTGIIAGLVFNNEVNFMDKQKMEGSMDEIIMACFDKSLKNLWAYPFPGNNDNNITALTTDANGNIYMAGTAVGNISFTSETIEVTNLNETTNACSFIAKIDNKGKTTWAKLIPGTGNTIVTALAADDKGVLYAGGYFAEKWNFGGISATGSSDGDGFIAALSDNGKKTDWFLQGKTKMQSAVNSIQLNGNDIYAGGFFYKTLNFGSQALKTDEDTTGYQFVNNGFFLSADNKGNAIKLIRFDGMEGARVSCVSAGKNLLVAAGYFVKKLTTEKFQLTAPAYSATGFATVFDATTSGQVTTTQETTMNNVTDTHSETVNITQNIKVDTNNRETDTLKSCPDYSLYLEAKDKSYLTFYLFDCMGNIKYCGVVDKKGKVIFPNDPASFDVLPKTENASEKHIPVLPKPTGPILNDTIIMLPPYDPADNNCKKGQLKVVIEDFMDDGSVKKSTKCIDITDLEKEKGKVQPDTILTDDFASCNDLAPFEKLCCISEIAVSKKLLLEEKNKTELQEYSDKIKADAEKDAAIKNKMFEMIAARKKELDEKYLALISDLRVLTVALLNSIIANNKIFITTVNATPISISEGLITGSRWNKYDDKTSKTGGPVILISFKMSGFPKVKYDAIWKSYETIAKLRLSFLDAKGSKTSDDYGILTGPGLQTCGTITTGISILTHKDLKVLKFSLYKKLNECASMQRFPATSWKCDETDKEKPVIEFKHPNYNKALADALKAGIKEFLKTTTEGLGIVYKMGLAYKGGEYLGFSTSTVQYFTWAGATMADSYYEITGNKNAVLEFLKGNRDKIDFATDVIDAASFGRTLKDLSDISNPDFAKSMTDVLQMIEKTYNYQTEQK